MTSERAERLAKNEALFRAANERMADWEEIHEAGEAELYFCECADPACRDRVSMTKTDYEHVRSDPCHFFIIPGHEVPDIETVVETHDGWIMIEKDSEVSDIVESYDRRT